MGSPIGGRVEPCSWPRHDSAKAAVLLVPSVIVATVRADDFLVVGARLAVHARRRAVIDRRDVDPPPLVMGSMFV